jgi:hypothetical protein
VYMRVREGGAVEAAKPVMEGLSAEQQAAVVAALGGQPGDLLLFAAGASANVNKALDRVRLYLGRDLGLIQVSARCARTAGGRTLCLQPTETALHAIEMAAVRVGGGRSHQAPESSSTPVASATTELVASGPPLVPRFLAPRGSLTLCCASCPPFTLRRRDNTACCGWWTSPCLSGTLTRGGWRRCTTPSPRPTLRTWRCGAAPSL